MGKENMNLVFKLCNMNEIRELIDRFLYAAVGTIIQIKEEL